jgi:hypothetical protein
VAHDPGIKASRMNPSKAAGARHVLSSCAFYPPPERRPDASFNESRE